MCNFMSQKQDFSQFNETCLVIGTAYSKFDVKMEGMVLHFQGFTWLNYVLMQACLVQLVYSFKLIKLWQ